MRAIRESSTKYCIRHKTRATGSPIWSLTSGAEQVSPAFKVSFNKVFGYYIEVTNAHADKVPDDYVRKQTLVNAERYITPELKEYESRVLNAEEEILSTERAIFSDLCGQIASHREALLTTALAIAHLDVFLSLAAVAVREGYARPQLTEDNILEIEAGRHPVVEKLLESSQPVT